MGQYGWTNCPSVVHEQIDRLLAHLKTMLSGNLVGIYLHGSLAMGCFNAERSDIDLLVVMRHVLSVEVKRDLVQLLLRSSLAPQRIEISFLAEPDMRPFQHPLPYDLHYSESWRERYTQALATDAWRAWNDETRYDYDLAAHLTITRTRGICLYGRPILEAFPEVPPEAYASAILGDFDEAFEKREAKPVYFVLNACRVLAFLREGRIFSKDEGGSWGLQALPQELRGIVRWELEMYRGERTFTRKDHTGLDQFAQYMRGEIDTLQSDTSK